MEQASVFFNFTLKKFTEKSRELQGTPCDVYPSVSMQTLEMKKKCIKSIPHHQCETGNGYTVPLPADPSVGNTE
jgi:hypothetical protein